MTADPQLALKLLGADPRVKRRNQVAAQNHVRSGSRVPCITVPALTDVWRPQAVQIHKRRHVSPPASLPPQPGQTNPSGQRDANT